MQRTPLQGALFGRDGTMRELEYRLLETLRSDFAFLRSMGIEPCLIDRPLPLPYPGRPGIRITGADARWLKACGVAWEPGPAFQLTLDFCGHETQRSTCQGSGNCRACRDTGQR
jgi:hypothetical protein